MKRVVLVACLLLGFPLVVFGLNGFLHFMEPPGGAPPEAVAFLVALAGSGYPMPVESAIEVLCGAMLVTGCCVPLALVLFAPIPVNIVGFHLALDPDLGRSAMGYALLVAELFLARAYLGSFRCLFEAKSRFHAC
jgi:hypothetical protein